jgi:hypothetical protein
VARQHGLVDGERHPGAGTGDHGGAAASTHLQRSSKHLKGLGSIDFERGQPHGPACHNNLVLVVLVLREVLYA